MIGTISVGGEKVLAACAHYDALKGVDCRPVVWTGPYGSLYMGSNGEVQDQHRNRVLDLPIDPVLATMDDVVAYVAGEMAPGKDSDHDHD